MNDSWKTDYATATRLARDGEFAAAKDAYTTLRSRMVDMQRLALVTSDLGTLEVLDGNRNTALQHFAAALHLDGSCQAAMENLKLMQNGDGETLDANKGRGKVAIVSFLFNWPSTGGGIVHTVELAEFLQRAGFDVKLFCFGYEPWNIGNVDASCPFPVETIRFAPHEWTLPNIEQRIRAEIDEFAPDSVIVTDAWNIKPYLVGALKEHRVFLRMQAQECLCPLNNLRFRPTPGGFAQCGNNQLSGPQNCGQCFEQNAATSGQLHRLERELCGVGTPEYHDRLMQSLQEAEAVLVLNPNVAESWKPFCRRVEVVTWGMDPARFPTTVVRSNPDSDVTRILFAGLTHEFIKGFHVLHEACEQLWKKRQDFELVVTDQAPEPTASESPEPFARYVGWKTQRELPDLYHETEITVVPTIVQDGLSRTSVEAMASGKPVVASRIGGIPYTVSDGETGLLFEPGNAIDLAAMLEKLLDDPSQRRRMGAAGRAEFERRFQWPDVIERGYRPLLQAGKKPRRTHRVRTPRLVDSTVSTSEPNERPGERSTSGPLRILFLANFSGFWNNPSAVADVLEQLGHQVTRRHEFAVPHAEALLEELDSGRYDCLLFSKGRLGAVTPQQVLQTDGDAIVEVLSQTRVPAFMWYVDRVLGFDPAREAWMRRVAPLCRVAFVTDGPLAATGWANFRILRQGIFRHHVANVEIPENQKRDVAFVGSIYGSREAELAPVRHAYELDEITGIHGPQLSEVLNRYRIILGPRFPSTPHYWSDRIYLILGHGGFFLAPEVRGMREEGFVPGVHYAPLGASLGASGNDPVADVRHWLDRPDKRNRIAQAGRQLAHQRFSYHARLKELCRVIRESLSTTGSQRTAETSSKNNLVPVSPT